MLCLIHILLETKRGLGDENGGEKETCSFLVIIENVPFALWDEYSREEYSGGWISALSGAAAN
jgi:hypothetical protein